jgi:hypothetical protein
MPQTDPLRWSLLGRVAVKGQQAVFMRDFYSLVVEFEAGKTELLAVVYAIGRVFWGRLGAGEALGARCAEGRLRAAERAAAFFARQRDGAQQAARAWTLAARRLGVMRDLRLLVARLVWNARDQILY